MESGPRAPRDQFAIHNSCTYPLKPLLATIEKGLVLRKLGRLVEEDRRTLQGVLNEIVGEQHHR